MTLNPSESTNNLILTSWVYDSLIRNKVDLSSDINYDDIRNCLSIKEMARIAYLNNEFKINNCYLSALPLHENLLFIDDVKRKEYESIIIPMSKSQEEIDSVLYQLSLNDDLVREDIAPYKLIATQSKVITILDRGFLAYIDDSKNLKSFLTNLLKELYKLSSIEDVNKLSIFKVYLDLI